MRNATILFTLGATLLLAGGCRKQGKGEDNPRCRVFEEDPATVDPARLPELEAAYKDLQLLAECARSAAVSVDEYMERQRVQERLDSVGRKLHGGAETVVEGARQRMTEIERGASRALAEQERRMEEQWKAVQESVQ